MFYPIHSCPNATCCPRFIPFSIPENCGRRFSIYIYIWNKIYIMGISLGPLMLDLQVLQTTFKPSTWEDWNNETYIAFRVISFWCVSPRTTSHAMFACMAPVWCMVAAEVGKGATTWIGWALGGVTIILYCMQLYPHIAIPTCPAWWAPESIPNYDSSKILISCSFGAWNL